MREEFWREYLNLTPDQWLRGIDRFLQERFEETEAKQAACQQLADLAFSLMSKDQEIGELLQIDDFVASVGPPPPMIVEGLLPSCSFLLLAGKEKQGKSFLALQICEDVAGGQPLFGRWQIERPGPVVYFSMEGPVHMFTNRITQKGLLNRKLPIYCLHQQIDFSTPKGAALLLEKVRPLEPVLIVIDTARQALDMEDWNDAAKVTKRLKPILGIIPQLPNDASILMLVHNNKNPAYEGGSKISGSNALPSHAEGYLILDHKKKLENGDLRVEVECDGRIDMPDKFAVQMDNKTLMMRYTAAEEVEETDRRLREERQEKYYERIERAVIAFNHQASIEDVIGHVQLSRSFVSEKVAELKKAGRLILTGEKPSGGGRPILLYGLPPR